MPDDERTKAVSRFWMFVLALLFCAMGLAGLLGALFYLDRHDAAPQVVDIGHPGCPHEDCAAPHLSAESSVPEGMGGGALCTFYLVYCGAVFGFALDYKPR